MKMNTHTLSSSEYMITVYAPRTEGKLPVLYMNVSRPEDMHSYLPKLAPAMGKTIRQIAQAHQMECRIMTWL